jgi:tRNA (guanine26-N2/guanine27-N2)-dimethyltransferase
MREWVRQKSPIKEGVVKEGQSGWKILQGIRKGNDAEETNGEANQGARAEDGSADATPEVVTEPTNGHVVIERPTDVKTMKVVFDEKLGKDKPGKRLVRYQENPKENWGPMRKARGTA